MLKSSLLSGLAGLSLLALASAPASANTWTLLGQQQVGFDVDKDVFHVGREEGRFDALRFRVIGNKVIVADVIVHYGNGTTQHLNVKEHMLPGETTPAYDLKGDHRRIDRIEVLYQTEGAKLNGRATMQVLGSRFDDTGSNGGSGGGNSTGWETLGSRSVGFHVDHDSIKVGDTKGLFRALKLSVQDHDVYMYNLRVRFANGEDQELPVNSLIKAGQSTPYLDLTGDKRTIDRIDMVYRTKPGFYGMAQVTVAGRH
jgi:Protein of unknown function (DUF2541)